MENLSEKQAQVLKFLIDFNAEHGFPPTIRELCHYFGFKSLNTAHFHLRSLEKKGQIQIHPGKGRGITLPGARPLSERQIPVVGKVAAGMPIVALENIEEFLGIDKRFFWHRGMFCGSGQRGLHGGCPYSGWRLCDHQDPGPGPKR